MSAQTETYDGTHFQAETVNLVDGSVEGHAAGCADLTRKTRNHADEPILWDCLTKEDVREGYNGDFDEETDGWYNIDWKPCANHIPVEVDEIAKAIVESATGVEVKRGPKWTYIFVNGEQVMEVRSQFADQVLATVNFF